MNLLIFNFYHIQVVSPSKHDTANHFLRYSCNCIICSTHTSLKPSHALCDADSIMTFEGESHPFICLSVSMKKKIVTDHYMQVLEIPHYFQIT